MLYRRLSIAVAALLSVLAALGADPTATRYSAAQCAGSAMPYPAPQGRVAAPDSLKVIFINHVGRHGARYLSSSKAVDRLIDALHDADSASTITPQGRALLRLAEGVHRGCKGRWGALDSLGMAEQRGIAVRLAKEWPHLVRDGRVTAAASRTPRCVNSMYTFLYQLTRLHNSVDISAVSGPMENPLLRPFQVDETFLDWMEEGAWRAPLETFIAADVPLTPLIRVLGASYAIAPEEARELAIDYYKVIAGMAAMGMPCDALAWFTTEEYNALWAANNLRQYLQRTATTLSAIPAEVAAPLLLDLIATTEEAADAALNPAAAAPEGVQCPTLRLRFGHAETLMPLLSLMRLPGAYYMTNYFDTVGLHWRNFDVAPMAANLQLLLLRGPRGRLYLRVDLNEKPVSLDATDPDAIYLPWTTARDRLLRCIPLYLRN